MLISSTDLASSRVKAWVWNQMTGVQLPPQAIYFFNLNYHLLLHIYCFRSVLITSVDSLKVEAKACDQLTGVQLWVIPDTFFQHSDKRSELCSPFFYFFKHSCCGLVGYWKDSSSKGGWFNSHMGQFNFYDQLSCKMRKTHVDSFG